MRKISYVVLAAALAATGTSSPATAQYFGQNKVQYRSFDWQVLESEHFDLYFYEAERSVAVDAARMAERAYERLSDVLDYDFEEKIPLIIYASHTDFQSTNVSPGHIHEGTEGVTELMKRRVFLPFTGSYAEFRHVLEHELVHAFQLGVLMGRAENVLSNPMSFIPPLWVMEGMAEYLALGQIDAHTEMWLRDAALQGYLLSIEDLAYTPDIRVYRFGQAIMAYIGERFGDRKIGAILERSTRTRSIERAIQETLGMSLEKLSEDWTQHVRRTYLPAIADHLKPAEFARPLTGVREDLANFNLAVSVSPDGNRFTFISDRSLYNDVYLASAIDGKVDRRLIKGERTGDFESLRFFRTATSWSPDGRYIALPAQDGGDDVIVVFDVEKSGEAWRIQPGLDGVLSPSWSPDGERLVFTGIEDGHPDVYTIARDGSDLRRVTSSRHAAKDPVWSPDGTEIAFVTDIGPDTDFDALEFGDFRIGIVDIETGHIRVPAGQTGKCINPQWSPGGDKILFISDRTGISNIYVMNLDGSDVRQLTNVLSGVTGLTAEAPAMSLSRDGSRLLFTAFAGGGFDVFAMDYPLGVPPGDESQPAPDAWIVDARGVPQERLGRVTRTDAARPSASAAAPEAEPEDGEEPAPIGLVSRAEGGDAAAASEGANGHAPYVIDRPGGVSAAATDSLVAETAGLLADAHPPFENPAPFGPNGAAAGETDEAEVTLDPGEEWRRGEEVLVARADAEVAFPEMSEGAGGDAGTGGEEANGAYHSSPALPDSSSFRYRDYRLRFTPDFVTANGLFASSVGVAAQTAIGFSDVLGNHQFIIGASVYGSLLDADLFLSYANLSRRTNYGLSLFQYRSDFIVQTQDEDGDQYVSQIHRGVELAVSRPFDRFKRLELGIELTGIEERTFGSTFLSSVGPTTFIDIPGDDGSRLFVRPRVALVSDNVVYGNTGPISGTRSRFEVDHALGGVDFTTFFGDFRHYFNTRQQYVLAVRGVAATSVGANPQTFRIGGPYTLRGYDFGELRGHSTALLNAEFRFPLIDFVKLGWPLPIAFSGIRGLVFFDAGTAWDDREDFKPIGGQEGRGGFYLNDVRASWGFGARMNLFGFLIARWDLARRTDLDSHLGPWGGRFALGAEF